MGWRRVTRLGLLTWALAAPPADADASARFLPMLQVFPGDDGATPALLDVDLGARLKTWKLAHPGEHLAKRLVVHKSRRRLDVFAGHELLKVYLVNLGYAPEGTKQIRGDMKTPEGHLFICAKNQQSQFVRFLELAYPRPEDAERGMASRLVAESVQERTHRAYLNLNHCPPQETALGGAVGIHGSGGWSAVPGGFAVVDWTWGCVGLRTADILELFNTYAEVGVPVDVLAD